MNLKRLLTPVTSIAFALTMLVSSQTQASAATGPVYTLNGGRCEGILSFNSGPTIHTDIRMDKDLVKQTVVIQVSAYDYQAGKWLYGPAHSASLASSGMSFDIPSAHFSDPLYNFKGTYYLRATCWFNRGGQWSGGYISDIGAKQF